FEGKPVLNIQFDPKEQPLEPSELFEILPLKAGQPLSRAVVRASIDRLFATGRYADIQVDAAARADGVVLTFVTRNSWFIGGVSVTGVSDPPNASQLENTSRLDLGQPYTASGLQQAVDSQTRLLESNGFYRSHLQPVFEYDSSHQQVNIRFEISSGPRARFGPPVLIGDLKMEPARIVTATKFRRWILNTWKPITQLRV